MEKKGIMRRRENSEVKKESGGEADCPFPKLHPSELRRDGEYFMSLAFNEARKAWAKDEVPVGAVVVIEGQVVARAHNQVEGLGDPTAHAEMLAITQASAAIGDWRLNAASLYVTKEPCPMCAGASIMSRLGEVIFAAADPKMGCLGGALAVQDLPGLNHRVVVRGGVLAEPCSQLLQAYFRGKRSAG
jgi:tRNA(adenine34) deaminase